MNEEDYTKLLTSAVGENNLEVVKFAIDHGADIHVSEDYPLRTASKDGYVEIVKLLLFRGADIHAQGGYSHRYACHYNHIEVVKLLKEHLAKEKKVETLKIGNMIYNKGEVEEKLKDLKPLDS